MKTKEDKLLVLLNELQERLDSPDGGTSESNLPERYVWFMTNSSSGEECQYAKKTLRLFMKRDFMDIRDLIYNIYNEYRKFDD